VDKEVDKGHAQSLSNQLPPSRARAEWSHAMRRSSLRHSFNAALANAGVGVELRQELTGHSSPEMNKNYTHPDIERMREAVLRLPDVTNG
jgi:site-specific recombinase XerD